MKQTEHQIQSAFFKRIALEYGKYPHWRTLVFAIPNGGARNVVVAKKLKDEGVKRGVPDVLCSFPRGEYHGLYIEFKAGKNKPTPEQSVFAVDACNNGYMHCLCYSWEDAFEILKGYENL